MMTNGIDRSLKTCPKAEKTAIAQFLRCSWTFAYFSLENLFYLCLRLFEIGLVAQKLSSSVNISTQSTFNSNGNGTEYSVSFRTGFNFRITGKWIRVVKNPIKFS